MNPLAPPIENQCGSDEVTALERSVCRHEAIKPINRPLDDVSHILALSAGSVSHVGGLVVER